MYSSLHMNAGSSFDALGSSARSSSSVARAIRAEEYSLRNRLRSLHDDREFVAHTRRDFPSLPFFLNLRCGLWYAPPHSPQSQLPPSEGCYFKSTDGHAHHWKFSTARLNANVLLRIIQQAETSDASSSTSAVSSPPRCTGALIVDSTRKGKRFPDSFSRTIPIWCAVWNRALAAFRQRQQETSNRDAKGAAGTAATTPTASDDQWDTSLHMPLWVSEMESRQIEERLPGFVSVLLASGVDFAPIARGLKKPLRCLWIDRQSAGRWANGEDDLKDLPFTPLLLLQCSRVESETRGIGQRQGWSYIQGAGDDEENWTSTAGIKGFAPSHLTDQVMKTALQLDHEEEIVEYLREVMQETTQAATATHGTEGRLQLHRIPYGASTILATTTLPTHAAVIASLAGSDSSSLCLLHLYFDSTAELKQQRKAKLAAEAQRALEKAMRRGDDDDGDEEDDAGSAIAIPAVAAPESSVDLLDWPQEARLAVPVSSAAKSRDSLQSILPSCLDFIQRQSSLGRTLVLSCSDLSFISCLCTAAIVARTNNVAGTAVATPASNVAAATAAASFSSAFAAPSSDKSLLRVTLTSVKSHLPEHFPTRLLLKQLNTYFLSKGFQ